MSSAKEECEEHEDISVSEDTRTEQNDNWKQTPTDKLLDYDVAENSVVHDLQTCSEDNIKIADRSVTAVNLDSYGSVGGETTEHFQKTPEAEVFRSSSYENIYVGTKLPGDECFEYSDNVDISTVGDPYYVGHEELHLTKRSDGRSSSFENLYENIQVKEEVTCEKEEEVGEKDDETGLNKPENGGNEDGKENAGEEVCVRSVPSGRPSVTFENEASLFPSSPIDITLESGLDKIGHGKSETSPKLQHSLSYDTDTDSPVKKTRRLSTGSTPDEIELAAPHVEKSSVAARKGIVGYECNNLFSYYATKQFKH
jgi:hypothetical protein